MPYSVLSKKSGKTYYLHSRRQELKGGHVETLYFFTKEPREGALDSLPSDREIWENPKTGLPLAKKKSTVKSLIAFPVSGIRVSRPGPNAGPANIT